MSKPGTIVIRPGPVSIGVRAPRLEQGLESVAGETTGQPLPRADGPRLPLSPADGRILVEGARERYLADQLLLIETQRRRKLTPWKPRADVRFLDKWIGRGLKTYEMVTSFLLAHALLWVGRATRDRRAAYCQWCTFRFRRWSPNADRVPVTPGLPLDRRDRCHGEVAVTGKGCGCWDDPVWRPASLLWQIWLRLWRCPIGHWDRCSSIPDPPVNAIPARRD